MRPGPRRRTSTAALPAPGPHGGRRRRVRAEALGVVAATLAMAVGTAPTPSVAVAATACSAPAPGAALSWGAAAAGQLGQPAPPAPGQPPYRDVPAQVADLAMGAGITQVAAGDRHGLALGGDGSVWAWGDNAFGQLGDATTTKRFRTLANAVVVPGSTALRAPFANFTPADVGRPVTGLGIPPATTVAAVASSTEATLSAAAVGVPVAVALGAVAVTTQSPGRTLAAATGAGDGFVRVATDAVHPGGVADATTTFRAPVGSFSAADVGRYLLADAIAVGTTVVSVPDSATAVLSAPALAYYAGVAFSVSSTAPFTDGSVDGATLRSQSARFSQADVGRYVSADALLLGTRVTAVPDASTALLSHAASQPLANVAFRLGPTVADDVGRPASGPGIPSGAAVDEVAADRLHLSAPATATGSITLTLGAKDVASISEGRTVTDAVAANGSPTLRSASGAFAATDVGRSVTGPGIAEGTTIAAFVDASTVTLSKPATPTESVVVGSTRPVTKVVGLPGPARAIAAGATFSLAVLGDGSVWAWGQNSNRRPGDVAPDPPDPNVPNATTPVQVQGLSGVTQVAAGASHALARAADGSVWSWGYNDNGQLGVGSAPSSSISALWVAGLPRPVSAVAAAGNHSLAVLGDGTVWGWGQNTSGVLGTGAANTARETTPVQVGGGPTPLGGIATVATGADHSLGVDGAGRVWAWGANQSGELGDPSTPPSSVRGPGLVPGVGGGARAVAAGLGSSLVATADGGVWGWGRNESGQLGLATSATPVAPTKVATLDHVGALAMSSGPALPFSLAVRTGGSASLTPCPATTPQSAIVGRPFATALAVVARDGAGAPAPGVAVSFAAPASGPSGSFGAAGATVTVVTGADGVAIAPDLVANGTAGAYRVTAGAAGHEAAFFELANAAGPPTTATALAATTPQHTRITTAFATRLALRVTDARANPVAATVSFAVHPAGGGAGAGFNGATTVATDAATGIAIAPALYANNVAGSYTATATVAAASVPDVVFELTNDASVPATLAIGGGDAQAAEVGALFAVALRVQVSDAQGQPAVAAAVRFRVLADARTGAGASFVDGPAGESVVSSGPDGEATAAYPLRANANPGSFRMEAVVVGTQVAPVRFSLTNTPQPAPVVSGLAPAGGPTWGGTKVVVSGSGFARSAPVTAVWFGDRPAQFRILTDTAIAATAPAAGGPGSVHVTVVVGHGALSSASSGADRFSYLAGGWVPTASMSRPRAGHTATVLDPPACRAPSPPSWCGTVLVAGGEDNSGSTSAAPTLDSAEIYTPPGQAGAGRWSDTAPMVPMRTTVSTTLTVPDRDFNLEVASTAGFPMPGSLLVRAGTGTVTVWCNGAGATTFTGCGTPHPGVVVSAGAPVWSLRAGRSHHSATLLDDGRVLVAGGSDGAGAVVTAEIYDPASGTWAVTAPMRQARFGHTATKLADGRVLVVGGKGKGPDGAVGALVSAEVFDPAGNGNRGSWTPAAALHQPRAGHTATLVDGTKCRATPAPAACRRVLVAGGEGSGGFGLATYELYDPSAGSWSEAALPTGRALHAAAALPDATVVVSGGCCTATVPPGDLAGTDAFDPTDNAGAGGWRSLGALAQAREAHSAVVLGDGTVVVMGGSAGQANGAVSATEALDPAAGIWGPRGNLIAPRRDQAAVALAGNRALVVGGADAQGRSMSSAELLDTKATQPPPSLSAVSPNVVAAGGGAAVTITGSGFFGPGVVVHLGAVDVSLRDQDVSDTTIVVTAPPQPRGSVAVSVSRGAATSAPTPAGLLRYTDEGWSSAAPLDVERTRHTATLIDGTRCRVARPPDGCSKVLVVGGFNKPSAVSAGEVTAGAVLFDPRTGRWTATGSLNQARSGHTATLLGDGSVLVVGGADAQGRALATAEVYDPVTGSWTTTLPMAQPRLQHTATVLGDGRVLVAGGASMTDFFHMSPLATAEIYRFDPAAPASGAWGPTGSLTGCADAASCIARNGHTATLLPDGSVLVVGGLTIPCSSCQAVFPVTTAERYDPGTGSWQTVAGLPQGAERAFHTATALPDGKVVVAGGLHGFIVSPTGGYGVLSTATVYTYDPATARWTPTAALATPRAAHTASLLGDGRVVVAGGATPVDGPSPGPAEASSEVFDPAANAGRGAWEAIGPMLGARGNHTATVLDGPACHQEEAATGPPVWCGSVLVAGGTGTPGFKSAVRSAELFTPGPRVRSVSPAVASVAGGTQVAIDGSGFTGAVAVRFGDVAATSVTVASATHLVATAPPQGAGTVTVTVTTAAGSSAALEANPGAAFSYQATPGVVTGLSAQATGDHDVTVRFGAAAASAGDDTGPPARLYELRESLHPIDGPAAFAATTAVCAGGPSGQACVLGPAKVGDALSVAVGGLEAGTTYHYAVAAVNDAGVAGAPSASVRATTTGTAPVPTFPTPPAPTPATPSKCPPSAPPGPAQVRYPAGYSLLGAPAGSVVGAGSHLYGWTDAGAGGSYSTTPATTPVAAGRGYFAWFACPHLVTLAGAGTTHARLALGAYHASMVANPSATTAVRVAGFDYAARWDPTMHGGAGGYHLSGFRQAQTLAVGEGLWVFSYTATTVAIDG